MNDSGCSFPGCVKESWAKELCPGHYAQLRKGKELKPLGEYRKGWVPANKRSVLNGNLRCSKCKESLPVDKFSRDAGTSSGYRSWCKPCDSKITREFKYGAEVKMLAACELCGESKKLVIDHDHACCPGTYTCGKCIRGCLCHACNTALGKLGDSVESLEKVIQYLLKSKDVLAISKD